MGVLFSKDNITYRPINEMQTAYKFAYIYFLSIAYKLSK